MSPHDSTTQARCLLPLRQLPMPFAQEPAYCQCSDCIAARELSTVSATVSDDQIPF